jgi:hypothetical protein
MIGNIIGYFFDFIGMAAGVGCSYAIVKMMYQIIRGHRGKLHYMCIIGHGLILIAVYSFFCTLHPMWKVLIFMPSFSGGNMMLGYVGKKVYKLKKRRFLYNVCEEMDWTGRAGFIVMIIMMISPILLP